GALEAAEPARGLGGRRPRELRDRLPAQPDRRGGGGQPRPAALRAERVRAVAREQHADVDLVTLGLEPVEEAVDPVEVPPPLDEDFALVRREPRDWDVGPAGAAAAGPPQIAAGRPVRRRVPGRAPAPRERQPRVPPDPLALH